MPTAEHDVQMNDLSAAAELIDIDSGLTFKPMFGGVMAYLNGLVFASLSNIGLAFKLAPKDQDALLAIAGAKRLQYEPDSTPSKQYIVIPENIQKDSEMLSYWLRLSADYIASLPVKKPKKSRA